MVGIMFLVLAVTGLPTAFAVLWARRRRRWPAIIVLLLVSGWDVVLWAPIMVMLIER